MKPMNDTTPYIIANKGSFKGIRHWHEFDEFWQYLETLNDGQWFIYDTHETPPSSPTSNEDFLVFLKRIHRLLHEQHQEDYCGIVYVDQINKPEYIKIYDPANLGVTCGYSDNPPLPGWILSRIMPCDLNPESPPPLWKKYLHKFI